MMRDALTGPGSPALGLLKSVWFDQSEAATGTIVIIVFFILMISLMSPSVGVLTMEVGFPILAAWILVQKTADRFAPTVLFPAIYLLWFWLGNVPLLRDDRAAALATGPGDRVWFYCLLGLFAYLCGTLVIRGGTDRATTLRGIRERWHDSQLLLFLAFLGAGIFLAWASITVSEGLPILSGAVDTFRLEIPTRHRIAYQVLIAFSTLMFPLIYLYLWSGNEVKFRKTLYAFSLFIVFVFVSLGSRGLVLPAVLTTFALRHYLLKPWPIKYIMATGLILLPLLSVSGYYRSLQHFGPAYALDLIDMGMPIELQPFTNVYLYVRAPVETFRSVLQVVPAVRSFQHGAISVGFFLQLLPGRHPSSDYFFKELLGHPDDGFGEPASILGTFYADFGGAGIFAGMFLTGFAAKFLYVHMFRGSLGWVLAYCFLWQKLVGSLYGSLFTYITEVLVPLTWIVLVWVLTNVRERRSVFATSGAEQA